MPLAIAVPGDGSEPVPVEAYTITDPLASLNAAEPAARRLRLPRLLGIAQDTAVTLHLSTAHGPLAIPATAAAITEGTALGLPLSLAARLRRALEQPARFDPDSGRLQRAGTAFNGFRLYAASIDEVGALQDWLDGLGIATDSEIQAIERIRILDAGLRRLFWLIAALAIAGSVLVLLASLLAAVERKTAEIAQLRLLGLTRLEAARFPVHQGLMLTFGGTALGLLAALGGAAIINQRFAADLGFAGEICRLAPGTLATMLVLALLLAPLTALAAARRVTRIEPSEALRHE
jgi:putative ABC transport system permease protein